MEFTVKFVGSNWRAAKIDASRIGIDKINMIREDLGVQDLSIDRILDCIGSVSDDPVITISETDARKAYEYGNKIFADTNEVEVLCPDGWLNDCYVLKVFSKKEDFTGEILHCGMQWEIDTEELMGKWAKTGFSLNVDKQ